MNEYYRQSRIFSRYGFPALLAGYIDLQAPVQAFVTLKGVTITDKLYGTNRNGVVTLAYTVGGTAGAEVVTVTGNAISVQIESGVSTITQVRAAINASVAAAALVVATGTSATVVTGASAATPTAGAVEAVSASNIGGVASVIQDPSLAGTYIINLSKIHKALGFCQMLLQAATAVDLVPQLKSNDVLSAKQVIFRLNTGATPTDPAAACRVYVQMLVNDSTEGNSGS